MDAESQGVSSAQCVIIRGRERDTGLVVVVEGVGVLDEVQVPGKDRQRMRRGEGRQWGLVVQRHHHHSIASLSLDSA